MITKGRSPQPAPIPPFATSDGNLLVGGRSVTDIVATLQGQPCYLYDRQLMTTQVASLRNGLPSEIKLHYAVKANPMREVVSHLCDITDGLDVASAGELQLAIATGTRPENISFAGPGKSSQDLHSAVEAGVIICLESAGEMERLAQIARQKSIRPKVAVRVNPAFELKISGLKMGGGALPFGVDEEQVPGLLQQMAELPLDFYGFHIFAGGQSLREDALTEVQIKSYQLAFKLAEHAPGPVRWLNTGGGLGVPYFAGESPLQLSKFTATMHTLANESRVRLPQAELVLELGRYLVAPAGVYLCQIVDRKVSRGKTFLVTNGGMHHHLAASGNLGQVIRKNYPVAIANRMNEPDREQVSIVGPLCTPLDILADNVSLPRAGIGDLVAVFQSGAYGYTASPHQFLSHPPPTEMCL
jgi:diaminopimelate decarboxylase